MRDETRNSATEIDELIDQILTVRWVCHCPEIIENVEFATLNETAQTSVASLLELSLDYDGQSDPDNLDALVEQATGPFFDAVADVAAAGEVPPAALAIGNDLIGQTVFAASVVPTPPPVPPPGVQVIPQIIAALEAFLAAVLNAAGPNASPALRAAIDALRGFITQLRAMQQLGKPVNRRLLGQIIQAVIRVMRAARGLGGPAMTILRQALRAFLRQLAAIAVRLFGAAFGATIGTIIAGAAIGYGLGRLIGSIPIGGGMTVDDYLADCAYEIIFAPSDGCRKALGAMLRYRTRVRRIRQMLDTFKEQGLEPGDNLKDAYKAALRAYIAALQAYINQDCEDNLDIYRRELARQQARLAQQ